MTRYWLRELSLILGVEQNTTSHTEKIVSSLGGIIGIAIIYLLSLRLESPTSSILLVASMGASAVLVFAVPHGALSQPWPLIGGHTLSAIVGVICAQAFDNIVIASSAAVGSAIFIMYYLRCLHPPGGATALLAVIGGETIHNMGFSFVIDPILSNVSILLLTAIVFNYLFKWRHYPAHGLTKSQRLNAHKRAETTHHLTHEDFTAALQQLDSFIDVSAEDLSDIFERAIQHTQTHKSTILPDSITTDGFYSNGKLGLDWSIRQVTRISGQRVYYNVVKGQDKGTISYCSRSQFAIWASYTVISQEAHWVRDLQLPDTKENQPC